MTNIWLKTIGLYLFYLLSLNCLKKYPRCTPGFNTGSITFLIYVNDIQSSSKFFNFIKYADDTTLFNPMSQVNIPDSDVINSELE